MTVILDPGVLLNLAATQIISELGTATTFFISSRQADQPLTLMISGKLCAKRPEEVAGMKIACPGKEIEDACFLDYLVRLSAGESAAAAVAECRGWLLATDERKVKESFDARVHNGERTISTVGLLQHWGKHTKPKPQDMRNALCAIQDCAFFYPTCGTADALWWHSILGEASAMASRGM